MEEKVKVLVQDEAFVKALINCDNPEDVQKLFADHGVELTLEEVTQMGKALEKMDPQSGELSEDDLEDVAGGALGIVMGGVITVIGSAIAGVAMGSLAAGVAAGSIGWNLLRRKMSRW